MRVSWKRDAEGFQKYWLWQYGPGPFVVAASRPVRETPAVLGGLVEIPFEPGTWYDILVPEAAYQYRVEYGITQVTFFHSKWFLPVESC